jgi:ketosteroid isomerase-like protein
MAQENVEIVRRIYEAVERRDPGVLELYDPGLEFDFSRSPFGSVALGRTVYRGHAGLRAFFRERYEAWDEPRDDCEELIEVGDRVVSVVTSRGRGRESGVAAAQTHFAVWSLREGKVTSVRWFGTRDEALDAAGSGE